MPLRAGLSATTPRLPALASVSTEGALWGIRYYPSRAVLLFFKICLIKDLLNDKLNF
jgi:hypothetical protein